ncbi:MAG: hypothetical protein ACK5V0_05650 [Alphaproteobacteria bacterium]|jgi:hypothetical protein
MGTAASGIASVIAVFFNASTIAQAETMGEGGVVKNAHFEWPSNLTVLGTATNEAINCDP